jgi:hypothetical protein
MDEDEMKAFVLHKSLKDQDGQMHFLGELTNPMLWGQRAANEYSRPVMLEIEDGRQLWFEPKKEEGVGLSANAPYSVPAILPTD